MLHEHCTFFSALDLGCLSGWADDPLPLFASSAASGTGAIIRKIAEKLIATIVAERHSTLNGIEKSGSGKSNSTPSEKRTNCNTTNKQTKVKHTTWDTYFDACASEQQK